ncbi:LOW QUALITY PROTEIN: reverse transcriptase [Phytophthora megakarya]|uniref:Reverse transcriptase n=1 Tax=Phytophthora megakarya TaxID=4795 RepID=A0A225WUX8_9STRA|nr:LOW QUALITY PROTEIN: reverse transcriptase [Phytophthora megakarya]
MERQNLALEVPTDAGYEELKIEASLETAVDRPKYKPPRTILKRPKMTSIKCRKIETSQDQDVPDSLPTDNSPPDISPSEKPSSEIRPLDLASVAREVSDRSSIADGDSISPDIDPPPAVEDQRDGSDVDIIWDSDQDYDECVYYDEGSELYAEDVDDQMVVLLPEVLPQTKLINFAKGTGSSGILLIGKGNTLPPATRGIVCAIGVGEAYPLKCRSCFREKQVDLIKGLLSTKKINSSRSPWASLFVMTIKTNGVDIRLCIDYRSGVDTLGLFFGYDEWSLGSEDDESCSFDIGVYYSFGLFEWNRMHFGLKNAPQTDQRMVKNALYGFTRIPKSEHDGGWEPVDPDKSLLEYLGYKASHNGREANPKDLSTLTDLSFPG